MKSITITFVKVYDSDDIDDDGDDVVVDGDDGDGHVPVDDKRSDDDNDEVMIR